ncbi:MAG TPA: 4'-phosphopantetheinyl transferase superfamily protein [Polyangiaceae bacterium]|jgi:4'-phosphopantetheinyl transferase EntD|nr:4'-phosphopantetheinyl transferase superfamily protein [Polyangiaceae bacterium]
MDAPSILAGLLPDGVEYADGDPRQLGELEGLMPEEYAAIERAVHTRRIQYASARHLARRVFSRLGLPPRALLNRADRSPIWPEGYYGAITHTELWCAVAAAREGTVGGIGIDAEHAAALEVGVVERVLTLNERARIAASGHEPTEWGALWFSAKESVYKCVFPHVGRFIDFTEVELEFDHQTLTYRAQAAGAKLAAQHGRLLSALEGRFAKLSLAEDAAPSTPRASARRQCPTLWVTSAVLPPAR